MNNAALILSVLNIICIAVIGFLQWRSGDRRARSGEALDWSLTVNNLRREINDVREDNKQLKDESRIIKDLTKRLIKLLGEKGEPIILSPIEQALLYDTGPRFKAIGK